MLQLTTSIYLFECPPPIHIIWGTLNLRFSLFLIPCHLFNHSVQDATWIFFIISSSKPLWRFSFEHVLSLFVLELRSHILYHEMMVFMTWVLCEHGVVLQNPIIFAWYSIYIALYYAIKVDVEKYKILNTTSVSILTDFDLDTYISGIVFHFSISSLLWLSKRLFVLPGNNISLRMRCQISLCKFPAMARWYIYMYIKA